MSEVAACVVGAAGYGGGELLRLLHGHPRVGAVQGVSGSHGGQPVHTAHPNLRGIVEWAFVSEPDWAWLADQPRPVVLAALGQRDLASRLEDWLDQWQRYGLDRRAILIDLSGDFRLADAETYHRAYGHEHPCPAYLGSFVYGLAEQQGTALTDCRRIANPGCFATAIELALLPVVGLASGPVMVSGVTGASGSGTHAQSGTHYPTRANDFRAYRPGRHQHAAEVEAVLTNAGGRMPLHFVAHSAPLIRGIHVTAQCPIDGGTTEAAVHARMEEYWGRAPFVRVLPRGEMPRLAAVVGSNYCDIGVSVADGFAAVTACLDNLVKGMAGQAVQNMNLALGIEETVGLDAAPTYPG